MNTKSYRVKIAQQGREFEAEGDKAFVLEMLKRFESQPLSETTAQNKGPIASKQETKKQLRESVTTNTKGLSIREFIGQFDFKRHTDIILAFGYYLEKHSGLSAYTRADINNCYYEAKLDTSNTSQMIVQNIKRGFMMYSKQSDDNKGKNSYTLTAAGEKFIETKLSDKK